MKKQGKKNIFLRKPEILICVCVILAVGLVTRVGLLEKLELRVYDVLMAVKPATTEREDIVIVAIDDASIGEVGTFPWPRDILAAALLRMRELGAEQISFDIEYVSPSGKGVDPLVEKSIPAHFAAAEESITSMIYDLSDAIVSGALPSEYLLETASDLVQYNVIPEFQLLEEDVVEKLFRDNDEYFAQALHFFGNSWLTINAADMGIEISAELENYIRENMLLTDVIEPNGLTEKENKVFLEKQGVLRKLTPALFVLMEQATGAGFTNVILDSDGTRRRVELLHESEGQYVPQLVFGPLLYTLDTQTLERTQNTLIVKQALFPGETERRDVAIPLDKNGRMLVNWIPNTFRESFRNESALFLYDIDQKEQTLVELIGNLASFRIGEGGRMLSYFDVANYLLNSYNDLLLTREQLLTDFSSDDTRSDPRYDDYFARRAIFFEECTELTDSFYKDEIIALLQGAITDENRSTYEDVIFDVSDKFEKFASYLTEYNSLFNELKESYEGTFCIVGHTASNSTDLGTTPFEGQYPNIGTHANVYNTIINEEFITPIPWYVGNGIMVFLIILFLVIVKKFSGRAINTYGIIMISLFPLLAIIFIRFSLYMPVLTPGFAVIFSYLGVSVYRFATAEKDKKFLRHAFSTYLSEDVVAEIINDPSKLTLGGEEKNITALFTDIKGFSTFSEQVTPVQLVNILNEYLTVLSNIILEHKGTIDKYIGDAIVAFFGAPLPLEDHAWHSCVASIRMKEAEVILNKKLLDEGILPVPIYTRIGANTGNMVVGNMGTDMKMNYTIMGNDVNLAARLEGVNKKYESWILVSETTWNAADSGEHKGSLLGRRLDRVRVMGISAPVQLYNIVGLTDELSADQIECIRIFHKALDFYLAKDFVTAKKGFEKAIQVCPGDGPSAVFSRRCEDFIKQGVPEDWDGVLNMTTK